MNQVLSSTIKALPVLFGAQNSQRVSLYPHGQQISGRDKVTFSGTAQEELRLQQAVERYATFLTENMEATLHYLLGKFAFSEEQIAALKQQPLSLKRHYQALHNVIKETMTLEDLEKREAVFRSPAGQTYRTMLQQFQPRLFALILSALTQRQVGDLAQLPQNVIDTCPFPVEVNLKPRDLPDTHIQLAQTLLEKNVFLQSVIRRTLNHWCKPFAQPMFDAHLLNDLDSLAAQQALRIISEFLSESELRELVEYHCEEALRPGMLEKSKELDDKLEQLLIQIDQEFLQSRPPAENA